MLLEASAYRPICARSGGQRPFHGAAASNAADARSTMGSSRCPWSPGNRVALPRVEAERLVRTMLLAVSR